MKKDDVALFSLEGVKKSWDSEENLWYFSVEDVVNILTESSDPKKSWKMIKSELIQEGSKILEQISQVEIIFSDGKKHLADVASTEVLLRIIQSVSCIRVEKLKMWLSSVSFQRLQEISNPEIAINRALRLYFQKGYSKKWISRKLKSVKLEKALVDEWQEYGVKEGLEIAFLSDAFSKLPLR